MRKVKGKPTLQRNGLKLTKTWELSWLLDPVDRIMERIQKLTLFSRTSPLLPELEFKLEAEQLTLERCWIHHSSEPITLHAWRDAALLLEQMHDAKIVHWDVRPQNLIWNGEHLFLIDWEPSLLQIRCGAEQLLCSPRWMAPSEIGTAQPTQLSDKIGFLSCVAQHQTGRAPSRLKQKSWEDVPLSETLELLAHSLSAPEA